MYPVLIKIGPITIYTYGFFIFLGVLVGYLVCLQEAKKEEVDKNAFSNIILWTLIFSFLGAKFLYIIVDFKYFIKDPLSTIRSGFVFYGGIISGTITLFLLTKKYKISFLKFADIIALGLPLGHALGRIGCFCYGCCYGKPTTSWIGLLFSPDSPAGYLGLKVIPTQLISAAFLIVIFIILWNLRKKKRFYGQLALTYIILYSFFRFLIEFWRGDPRGQFLFLSTSQIIALTLFVLSCIFWIKLKRTS